MSTAPLEPESDAKVRGTDAAADAAWQASDANALIFSKSCSSFGAIEKTPQLALINMHMASTSFVDTSRPCTIGGPAPVPTSSQLLEVEVEEEAGVKDATQLSKALKLLEDKLLIAARCSLPAHLIHMGFFSSRLIVSSLVFLRFCRSERSFAIVATLLWCNSARRTLKLLQRSFGAIERSQQAVFAGGGFVNHQHALTGVSGSCHGSLSQRRSLRRPGFNPPTRRFLELKVQTRLKYCVSSRRKTHC